MILVVDTNLKEVKFWVFKENNTEDPPVFFIKDLEEVRLSKTLRKDILGFTGGGKINAISFRILFGGDFFAKASLITPEFFVKFDKLTVFFPFYIPLMLAMIKIFCREFRGVPKFAFFETSFFSGMPEEEKYYAIPYEFQKNNKIKKWGFHGIFHEVNSGMFSREKCISVVFDKQTTVCSANDGRPVSISLGFTPLEGVMSRTSCGDIDPGIVFYLMNTQAFSIYKIDDILKNESGFLGLTGYDLELKDLVKFRGKDRNVRLAFDIYQAQLLKCIGEGVSALGGLDNIVFSGSEVSALVPVIHSLIKKISFLGINTRSLPWIGEEEVFLITSEESGIKVCLNRMSLPKVILYATVDFITKKLSHR